MPEQSLVELPISQAPQNDEEVIPMPEGQTGSPPISELEKIVFNPNPQ